MPIVKIQTGANNPILRKKTKEVSEIIPEILNLISDMIETCKAYEGQGLAANQVGKNFRIFIVNIPITEKDFFVKEFINPEILELSKEKTIAEEGCLSLPGIYGQIKRAKNLMIKYKNKNGAKEELKASGILARVIQHEVDHLNGILITDKFQ